MIDLILIVSFAAFWIYCCAYQLKTALKYNKEINLFDLIYAAMFAVNLRLMYIATVILRPLRSLILYKRTRSP